MMAGSPQEAQQLDAEQDGDGDGECRQLHGAGHDDRLEQVTALEQSAASRRTRSWRSSGRTGYRALQQLGSVQDHQEGEHEDGDQGHYRAEDRS
jgi:hypothetical protein